MTQTSDRPSGIDPELEPGTLDDQDYGVPWALEDHHRDWQSTLRGFCEREVAPGAAERSIAGVFDADLARAAGRLGAYGLLADERYGGAGADLRSCASPPRSSPGLDSSLAVTVHVQAISARCSTTWPPEDLRAEFLPGMASRGRPSAPSASPSPPAAPTPATSPPGAPRRRRLGHQRGEAVHHQLRHPVLQVRDPLRRPRATTLRRERPVPASDLGVPRAARRARRHRRRAQVPEDRVAGVRHPPAVLRRRPGARRTHLLGQEGRGYREALAFLTWARFPIAAMAPAWPRVPGGDTRVRDDRTRSARRSAPPGGGLQDRRHRRLADTARLLTYDGAWKYDHGRPIDEGGGHVAKLVASEAANKVAYMASQLAGGYGFMDDTARHPALPGRPHPHDRRGHVGGPAHAHRPGPGAAGVVRRSPTGGSSAPGTRRSTGGARRTRR